MYYRVGKGFFMKKFVLVSLFLTLISGNALAEEECTMGISGDDYHLWITDFETSKADIPDACKAEIKKQLVNRNLDSLVSVDLIGFASNSGVAARNSTLSDDRARAVWAVLLETLAFDTFKAYSISAGESNANVKVPDDPNDNGASHRAVWVRFFYPETNDKYAEIISLKEACKSVKDGDAETKANGLFTAYISHLRKELASSEFEQSEIDAVAAIAAEHCTIGLKNFCDAVADAKWDDTEKKCKCNQEGYVALYDEKKCISQQTLADTSVSRATIDKISKRIDAIKSQNSDSFKVTVWRDAQGKFNTSRLISDSVAGVVLGTTGALVTSKLVKKSQIKNGFDDIQCTVGGQKVADWGDEFRVGIQ